jgi:hypothetical protein
MFAKPQKGLVPLGGNWYATPNTPQKPNYSDPFISPIDINLRERRLEIRPPLGILLKPVLDKCNIGMEATGYLGYMRLPSFQLLLRNDSESCQPPPPPPEPEPEEEEPYPFPTPPNPASSYLCVLFPSYSNIRSAEGIADSEYSPSIAPDGFSFGSSVKFKYDMHSLGPIKGEPVLIRNKVTVFPATIPVYATHVMEYTMDYSSTADYTSEVSRGGSLTFPAKSPGTVGWTAKFRAYIAVGGDGMERRVEEISFQNNGSPGVDWNDEPFATTAPTSFPSSEFSYDFSVIRFTEDQLAEFQADWVGVDSSSSGSLLLEEGEHITSQRQQTIKPRLFIEEYGGNFPPPPPEKKKMNCCAELRALLMLALKRIGSLPASVPDNFTKQNPGYINIESLAELMLWQMQQMDAVMGSYPIEIEIEDTDVVEEGNQMQKVTVPNAAEAIAEMMGMLMTMRTELNANLILSIKGMTEAGMAKKAATTAVQLGLANAEFLGYKLGQRKSKMPMLFSPNEDNLQKVMQEKEIEYIEYSNDDGKDFHDKIEPLLTMAARWNAQNWRRVTGDPGASLKEQIMTVPQQLKERFDEDQKEDFDVFTENAERGFTNKAGITNVDDPWGRPFGERPRVREIGQTGDNP